MLLQLWGHQDLITAWHGTKPKEKWNKNKHAWMCFFLHQLQPLSSRSRCLKVIWKNGARNWNTRVEMRHSSCVFSSRTPLFLTGILLLGTCYTSLRSKRSRAVSEQTTRNESQRHRFISRAAKAENPVPLSFFAQKPNGNACHAGSIFVWDIVFPPISALPGPPKKRPLFRPKYRTSPLE